MLRAFLFHNPHDKASRDLLPQVQAAYPGVTVMDFMAARSTCRFQGTPALRIDGGEGTGAVYEKAIDLTLEDVSTALTAVRELVLSAGSVNLSVGQETTFTVTALDIDGMPSSLPDGLTITVGEGDEAVTTEGAEATVVFQDAGTYVVTATAPLALPARLEVTVSG